MAISKPGDDKVDKIANEKLAVFRVAFSDLLAYYESKTDRGMPVAKNLPYGFHCELHNASTRLAAVTPKWLKEKTLQSEEKCRDLLGLPFAEYCRKYEHELVGIFGFLVKSVDAWRQEIRTKKNL